MKEAYSVAADKAPPTPFWQRPSPRRGCRLSDPNFHSCLAMPDQVLAAASSWQPISARWTARRCPSARPRRALIVAYYSSRAFTELSPGTQAARRPMYERLRAKYGDQAAAIPAKTIAQALEGLKPHAAYNWYQVINALMGYAVGAGMITTNPAANLKPPGAKSIKHKSWSAAEMAQYEAAHPIGTKARLAYALARYTGAGRADIARLGPVHIINGEIVLDVFPSPHFHCNASPIDRLDGHFGRLVYPDGVTAVQ
jgi:hypothetical protein